ncbi:hypothetical protein DL95DRAFT_378255 [Leptodontidium sp. 2 PMI_412]|nr:hypothetical protein DL95DRAFT_378255 [Leptodontidium sp. 2 PMI_412]
MLLGTLSLLPLHFVSAHSIRFDFNSIDLPPLCTCHRCNEVTFGRSHFSTAQENQAPDIFRFVPLSCSAGDYWRICEVTVRTPHGEY